MARGSGTWEHHQHTGEGGPVDNSARSKVGAGDHTINGWTAGNYLIFRDRRRDALIHGVIDQSILRKGLNTTDGGYTGIKLHKTGLALSDDAEGAAGC